ncbi:MATE family efflux transporter [Natrarchaeobaculum sulfurireducens]|uniref:Multidrug-efflux transporter n=1 Tax=Natrarchaeobaculum sulfurireducens TaxID=2044521 RepID=A0A346PAQ9_9EURY|nr:MATE family efflux transporter [Natrarchaeobaculum sulfurireducens]AXR76604.1 Na+-driven multidrug efflux pump [Natrarchaeobaculum sulfurireducens]
MTGRQSPLLESVASGLERLRIIDAERFRPTADLAWPRIVTGLAIMSKQTADLAMVGIAVGTAGTAGLAFALAYWEIVLMIGLGLSGGTVSLVSQNYGGDEPERASVVVTQSVFLAIAIALPLAAAFVLFAESLIGLFATGPGGLETDGVGEESLAHGVTYLVLVAPAVLFELLNLIASRTYTGVGDTFTEMVVRAGGALLNIALSALLIFGVGMGVAGAAIGTSVSTGAVTVVLAWGMVGRSYGSLGMEPSPVPISRSSLRLEPALLGQLIEISAPEIGRRIAEGFVVFPLLWIAATFGPVIVTALEVGRRVRSLINSVNWGLGLAASSLVGQHLGADEEDEAGAYGAAILRLATVVYVGLAAAIVIFAEPISGLFVSEPDSVAATATFVAVAAISAIGLGIDGVASGALLGAGDTRLPFLASLVGRYVFAVPAAALALLTPLGVVALYLALLLETYVPGGINCWLFNRGRWKAVSRRYRPSAEVESG